MKAIEDFPHTIYFEKHIQPILTEDQKAYLDTKYKSFFQNLIKPILDRGYAKYYGYTPPVKYEPTLYELLTYELLPFDTKIMDELPQPIISAQVLMEVSAGNVPEGVQWDIDQIRLFARWLDSSRLLAPASELHHVTSPVAGVEYSEHEHRHFSLRNYLHND